VRIPCFLPSMPRMTIFFLEKKKKKERKERREKGIPKPLTTTHLSHMKHAKFPYCYNDFRRTSLLQIHHDFIKFCTLQVKSICMHTYHGCGLLGYSLIANTFYKVQQAFWHISICQMTEGSRLLDICDTFDKVVCGWTPPLREFADLYTIRKFE